MRYEGSLAQRKTTTAYYDMIDPRALCTSEAPEDATQGSSSGSPAQEWHPP